MAILKDLVVYGSSRFLNKAYFNDLQISGAATFASLSLSGNLSVSGTSTLTGNTTVGGTLGVTGAATFSSAITANSSTTLKGAVEIYGSTPYIDFHCGNSSSDYTSRIIESQSGTLSIPNNLYVGTLSSPTAGITNLTSVNVATNHLDSRTGYFSTLLRATEYDFQVSQAQGGKITVAPTLVFPNSGTTITITKSGSTMTFTVKDATIISANIQGITWKANAKILVSGSLNELITGTMDGKISSVTPKGSAAQGQIVFTITASESNGNSSELLAAVASGSSGTQYSASQIKHFTVMVYNVDNFDVGIELNCYGDNSSMYLQMMSGTSATPVVRLGNLTGANLPSVITNGIRNTPGGYGLFATNAYLAGAIISTEGQIGGFTIGDTTISNGTFASSSANVFVSTGYTSSSAIGGSSGQKIWAFTAGNKYGVTTTGDLYASSATIAGKITATSGAIGGFDITSTAIKTKDVAVTSNTDNSISLSSSDFTRTINGTSRSGLRFAIGDKFGVTGDGAIYASSATISGTITATAGTIGGCSISSGKLYITDANISGTISANHIDASSLSIGQNQVAGLEGALNKVTAIQGTCSVSYQSTRDKVVDCSGFDFYDGALIAVTFSSSNTYYSNNNNTASLRLNVNGTGLRDVWVDSAATSNTNQLLWAQGAIITFRYSGNANSGKYIVVGEPRSWYGASDIAAGDSVKTDNVTPITGCVVCKGTRVSLSMKYENTADAPKLNISGTGEINLYSGNDQSYRPKASNGRSWTNESTASFVFDGRYWRIAETSGLSKAYTANTNAVAALTNANTAATKATSYITDITSNGVFVHEKSSSDVTPTTSGANGVHIASDVNIIRNAQVVATYGATTTIGQIADGQTRVQIDNDSLDIISRTGSTDTPVATFGEVSRIGIGSSIAFNNSSLSFSNENGDEIMNITGDGITIGKSGNPTFSVGSQSIALIGANKDDVFRVSSGGGGTYVEKDHRRYEANFSNSQVSSGVTVNAVQNIKQIASAPTNVKVNLFGYYTNTYTVDGQSVTTSEFRLVKTMSLSSSYYTSSYSNNANSIFGKIVLSSGSNGGVKRVQNWVSQYCTSGHILFTIQFEYDCHIPEYSQLNMNGNIVVSGTGGGNIACTDIDAGYINADVIDASGAVYTDTLDAPLFIYRDFSTSSLTVGANAAFAISFSQLNNYSVPSGYVPFAFSRISVDNNYLYFRWMNPDSIFNGSVAVGRNSSSSSQTFVLSVRIIFAQGGLFGT